MPDEKFSGLLFTKGHKALFHSLQKDAMMKKAGAGWFLFVAGAFLFLGGTLGGGGTAFAQEAIEAPAAVAPAEEVSPVVDDAAVPVPDFKVKVEARIKELRTKPVEDIEAAVASSEEAMQKLNEEARAARMATREAQEKMRADNPDVQAKYREIDEMRKKINAFIDELPEVKDKLDAESQVTALLMEETWFRTATMGLLAEKDRAAGFPERPEPGLNETATKAAPAVPEAPAADE